MPLEEVAERLGLEPDRYTPHQYKISQVYAISIKDQLFYDHIAQKGGGGAIDLVMHVQQSNFKEAIEWLNGNTANLTPIHRVNNSVDRETPEPQPFESPPPDDSKWPAVKDYLITTRGLPESLVDNLHQKGTVYADYKQNAVFVRKNLAGEVTGASLRGTYQDSKFKGLAKGTRRDAGWFTLKKGEGEPERIVLVESPIDALSAAAIAQKPETTLFLSTDGAGSIPHEFLQQQLDKGKPILVAYDNDEAGQTMAGQVLDKLPGAQRITPTVGKDWNEQLLRSDAERIAERVRLLLQKYGTSNLDGSRSFEGKQLKFFATNKSLGIYSKPRNQLIFQVDRERNIIAYQPNRAERELLDTLKQKLAPVKSARRKM